MKINKKKAICLGIFFVLFLMTVGNAAAVLEEGTETQITTNTSSQMYPEIYGERIVWQDDSDGKSDIYMYDISTEKETRITTSGSAYNPAIYGNLIVYEKHEMPNPDEPWNISSDIYMYDISTQQEAQITTSGWAFNPNIYGNRIVWDGRGIYLYDISTKNVTTIAEDWWDVDEFASFGLVNSYPVIYGNWIVWFGHEYVDIDNNYCIYLYDLSTQQTTEIACNMNEGFSLPDIYNDEIVYSTVGYESGMAGEYVYMYTISTQKETKITTSGSASDPAIYENRIVWQDERDGWDHSELYMFDLSTNIETQITTSGSASNPAIYGDRIPAIYGDRIVWQDSRNGNPDIYMFTLASDEVPEPPVADFSANITSGYAPLYVQFTDLSKNATEWDWDFGDGDTSIEQNPVHTYSVAGIYTVNLTVSNENGKDSELATIEVLPPEQEVGTLTKLASNVGYNSNPVWSPDGNEILFTRDDGLYKVSSDGSGEKKLASGKISQYAWSPDGSKISYIEINESSKEIWVMNADGTEKIQLLHADGDPYNLLHTWLPSGSKIFYAQSEHFVADYSATRYGTINSDGSDQQELGIIGERILSCIALSPDKSKVAFGSWPVVIQSLDENSPVSFNLDEYSSLVHQTQSWQPQVWSPDGSKIVYWSSESGSEDIYTINADGTGKTQLTAEASNENSPVFSPDGSKIVFVSDEAGTNDILIMDADGNNNGYLTTDTASDDGYPVWSPDGTKIAFWSDREGDYGIYTLTLKTPLLAFPDYTNPPTDLDQNGLYEDINGNGMLDFDDVVAYYDNMEWIEENAPVAFFDYNSNGLIDFDDVVKLYDML